MKVFALFTKNKTLAAAAASLPVGGAAEAAGREVVAASAQGLAVLQRDEERARAGTITLSGLGVRSMIDAGLEVQGSIDARSSVAIKGTLRGELHVHGEDALAVVFPGGSIYGTLRARYVWLAGLLEGKLICQRLLILPTGVFRGESVCETLEVKHGGEYFPASTVCQPYDVRA
ncbi:MAG: polymer-forming cytoskeletal protein [Rhodocyclaceae bacterium]|nr:polymer-forming cytoskeletal protein [Rhodocyclaceae bacterium]